MKQKKLDILIGIIIFIILLILKFPTLDLPYFWDSLILIGPTVHYLYSNPLTIFLWDYNIGHPPFFFIFVGVLLKIFGELPIIVNSAILFFSFLTLYFTYLVGKELFNTKIGIIASLLLLFTPIYFSYSGLASLAIPLAAFTIMTIYFAIKNKYLLYFIFGSLAILSENTGILVVAGVIIYIIIKEKKISKKILLFFSPLITFFMINLLNYFYYGKFHPLNLYLFNINLIKNIFNILIILKILFFDQYRFILTSFLILSFINFKEFKNKNLKKLLLNLFISVLFFIFLYNLDIFAKFFINLYPNINNYFYIVKLFSFLFTILLFITLTFYKNLIVLTKEKLILTITIIISILFHAFIIPLSPRYILFIFPLIYLFYSYSIIKIFKKYYIICALLIVFIFLLNFIGNRNGVGFTLETNMEYTDMIKTHQLAASYIENNYPNATVLAAYPQSIELQYTYGKYVQKPIKVITIPPYPGVTVYVKNYTQFLNPATVEIMPIDLSKIDLYYYSPQEFPTKGIYEIRDQLNLTLIKRFEKNNKSVEIYKVNH